MLTNLVSRPQSISSLVRSTFALGIISLFWCQIATATSYFIEPVEVVGKVQEIGSAFSELIKSHIEAEELGNLADTSEHANFTLKPKVIQTGSAAILSLSKKKKGKIIFAETAKMSDPEDLNVIAKRLVIAVMVEADNEGKARIGEITRNDEVDPSRRKPTRRQFFFGFGPSMGTGLGNKKTLVPGAITNYQLGIAWQIDDTMLRVVFEDAYSTDGGDINIGGLGISPTYFFSRGDISPLVSCGLIYGGAVADKNEGRRGFILSAGPGLMFFRTSQVNLETAVSTHVLMGKTTTGFPAVHNLTISVYW